VSERGNVSRCVATHAWISFQPHWSAMHASVARERLWRTTTLGAA
jgi:hypothetical protein